MRREDPLSRLAILSMSVRCGSTLNQCDRPHARYRYCVCVCISTLTHHRLEEFEMDQFPAAEPDNHRSTRDQITMRPKNELAAPADDMTQMVLSGLQ
jgi:hypothetical protein